MTAPPFTERPPATPRRSWSDWLPSTPALPTDPITPSDPGGPTRADRVIMHIDMDAFYASVELRRRPELRGRRMVGGGAERGVVLSANYEARAFGIEGGMPSSRARRLCPQAVAVPPDFDTYGEVSAGIVAAFESVTAHVESASIDEAYLDVTGSQRVFGSPRAIGEYLRALVADEQGITCSVGIGPSKFVAKIASGQAKPDGLVEVLPGDVTSFLHPLPVGKIWGVGEATADKLHRLGIMTVADLANTPADTLRRAFGPHQGSLLSELAWGRDGRRVVARPGERGVGCQETFSRDTDDPAVVRAELLRVAGTVAWRMRQAGVLGRVVTLNLRFADFRTISRSLTLASPTDSTDELHAQAMKLLGKLGLERPRIRRVGIRVEGLVDADKAYCQPTLDAPDRGWREAELAADAVRLKFGPNGVQRAVLTRHGYAPKRP